MKTVSKEEPVSKSRFIDCPTCKTRSLKLKRVVQAGRCKSCHESYKILIVYVKEGKKSKTPSTQQPTSNEPNSSETLPSWQIPSDSSLFGPLPSDTSSSLSELDSLLGHDDQNNENSTSQ